MAVTFLTGFESGQTQTDGITQTGTIARVSSTAARTGSGFIYIDAVTGVAAYITVTAAAYVHFGLKAVTRPTTNARTIFGSIAAGTINVRFRTDGALDVYLNTTLIGTSAVLSTTTWYWIGVRQVTGTSVAFLQIDGVDSVSGTATVTATSGIIGFSGTEATGNTPRCHFDDVICDDVGLLAPSKVDIAFPISDNARTAVTGGAGGTTDLWDAVNNVPPAGTASASETNTTNIEYPASLTESYTANLETYTTLGVGAFDTVLAVQSVIRHGEDITTGTKNGVLGAVSNPTISDALAFVFGADGGAHGIEVGFWVTKFGTLTTSPSVTLGNSPTLIVSRVSETRVGCVDFMGLLVAWTPGVAAPDRVPRSTPYPQLLAH